MKKLLELITNFKTIVRYGFARYDEDRFKNRCISENGISQLETIDLFHLNPPETISISPYSFLDGTSWVSDLYLLKLLAMKYPECQYLEIGSWRGESLANVAEVAANCTSVTLSEEDMKKLNFDKKFAKEHGVFSKNLPNIKTHFANSFEFDFNQLGQKFDLIFIDGDHTYNGVLNDTKKVFNLRRNNKSVIVWHDYGYSPETTRYSVLKGILDGVPKDKHKHLYHVSNTLCAIYIEEENIPTYLTLFPTEVNKYFKLDVTINKI